MQSLQHAIAAGPVVRENGDAFHRGSGQGVWDQSKGNAADSADDTRAPPAPDAKLFATLQARAAIAGFELVQMADSSFVAAGWTMTRAFTTRADVETFMQQVGAA